MPTTIRDVARMAGVGLGTVSRVLNNSPLVSDATRQRVLEVIAELDFSPSPIARRLSLGRTLSIAVIVPFFTRPAFVERLRGVESTLAESEYDLIIYNVETPERRDVCLREVPRSERVDGVLVLSLGPGDQDFQRLAAADVPIVFVDVNHSGVEGFHRVVTDDVAGGRKAALHLLDMGHSRVGFVGDSSHNGFGFRSSMDRFRGFCLELENAGLACQPDYCLHGQHGRFEARQLALQILALPKPPTAIFAASDTQAMGVLEAAARGKSARSPRPFRRRLRRHRNRRVSAADHRTTASVRVW